MQFENFYLKYFTWESYIITKMINICKLQNENRRRNIENLENISISHCDHSINSGHIWPEFILELIPSLNIVLINNLTVAHAFSVECSHETMHSFKQDLQIYLCSVPDSQFSEWDNQWCMWERAINWIRDKVHRVWQISMVFI